MSGVGRLPGPGRWPLAVRAGQLLFLSAQLPVDPHTGRPIEGYDDLPPAGRWPQTGSLLVDALEERMAAQVWWLYDRIGAALTQLGSSPGAILLLGGWVTDFRQWPVMNRIRARTFGPDRYPACTTFQVPWVGAAGAVAAFEALALADGPLRKEPLGSVRQVGAYIPGSKVGSLLFLAGEVPADPERGLVVRGYADLGAAGQALATGQIGADGWEGRIRAQAWYVYQRLARLLAEGGSSLDRVVKQNVYLRDPRDYPAFEGISRQAFGGALPATSVVTVDEYGHRAFAVEVELTAVAADAPPPARVESERVPMLGPGIPLAGRAGPLVFFSSQLPVDPATRRIVSDAGAGGPAALAARQAAQIYDSLARALDEQRLDMRHLVRQVIYVAEPALVPAVEAIAAAATAGAPPATTLVQVRTLWPAPALVQIEFTAYVGD
ncbi:MAG TPA: RidA family protein [Chloroflexota bacterium]|nr:RidA family protein [Chloroflexota bacterium]